MIKIRQYNIGISSAMKTLGGLVAVLVILLGSDAMAKNDAHSSVLDADQLLKHPEKIQTLLKQNKITEQQIPNPHWRSEGCVSCHAGKASATNKNLRIKNVDSLCNSCHKTGESHSIIHPVGISPNKKMLRRMPKDFLKAIKHSAGKMNCLTCHNIKQACSANRKQVHDRNPRFFRGGDYRADRTRLCFNCHDEGQYERLNPHKQLTKDGRINEKSCYICHESLPDVDLVTNIGEVNFNVEDSYSSVENDYSSMCNGCHPWEPHPGGSFSFRTGKRVNHLIVPPDRMMRKLKQSRIYLPLEPGSQRVFCGTCHNPHEKGVIKRTVAAQGAGSMHFLRDQKVCINCHEK